MTTMHINTHDRPGPSLRKTEDLTLFYKHMIIYYTETPLLPLMLLLLMIKKKKEKIMSELHCWKVDMQRCLLTTSQWCRNSHPEATRNRSDRRPLIHTMKPNVCYVTRTAAAQADTDNNFFQMRNFEDFTALKTTRTPSLHPNTRRPTFSTETWTQRCFVVEQRYSTQDIHC